MVSGPIISIYGIKILISAQKNAELRNVKFFYATDMFLRQNAENIVCVLIMKLHLSLPNLTWGKIIPGKLVVLGKVAGKKSGKSVVLCQTRGGGSSRVNKKPNLKFANVFFFNEHEESF